mgnify:CR=1 FL=1
MSLIPLLLRRQQPLQQTASEPAMPLRVAIHSSNGDSHFARSRWEGIHVAATGLTAPRARRAPTMSQRSAIRSSSKVQYPSSRSCKPFWISSASSQMCTLTLQSKDHRIGAMTAVSSARAMVRGRPAKCPEPMGPWLVALCNPHACCPSCLKTTISSMASICKKMLGARTRRGRNKIFSVVRQAKEAGSKIINPQRSLAKKVQSKMPRQLIKLFGEKKLIP